MSGVQKNENRRTKKMLPGKIKLLKVSIRCFAILAGLVSLHFVFLGAFGQNPSQVMVIGKIALKGNEPFTFLSISNESVEYQIVGELVPEIRKLQGQTVRLRGTLRNTSSPARGAAPARGAGTTSTAYKSEQKTTTPVKEQKNNYKNNILNIDSTLQQFHVFTIVEIDSEKP